MAMTAGDDAGQQENQGDGVAQVELGLGAAAGEEHVFDADNGLRQAGQNADGDHQRNAVADAAVSDLLAQPHEQHRAGGQDKRGLDTIEPDMGR